MSMLGKLFKKEKTTTQEFNLCIVDDTTSDLWVTLGITDVRRDEIIAFCEKAFENHEVKTDCYKEIVEQCKHINEVIPSCIIFERMCELHNNPLANMIQILRNEDNQ